MSRLKNSIVFWYALSRLISRGIPLVSVAFIYGFLEEVPQTTQLNGMFSLAVLVLFYTFYADLKEFSKKMYDEKWTNLTDEAKWMVFTGLLLLFIQWAKTGLGNLEVLFLVIFISQGLAIYPAVIYKKLLSLKSEKQKEKST